MERLIQEVPSPGVPTVTKCTNPVSLVRLALNLSVLLKAIRA